MKMLIAVDYEDVAGMVTWDSDDSQRMREFITADANAAAAGAFDARAHSPPCPAERLRSGFRCREGVMTEPGRGER